VDFAGEIGRTAALDFLRLEDEFSKLPLRRFIDFDLTEMPCYMSVRQAPTRTLSNNSKVWRLAQCESDKLRTEPLSRSLPSTMLKQRAPKTADNQPPQKRKTAKPQMASPKARKQLAHNAPVRRAASKARG
jgi:hypothetical protein